MNLHQGCAQNEAIIHQSREEKYRVVSVTSKRRYSASNRQPTLSTHPPPPRHREVADHHDPPSSQKKGVSFFARPP
jgi:hypothetical protein